LAKVQSRGGDAAAWTTLSVLFHVLDTCLRLLHPFMPYVTEETWQHVKGAFQQADVGILPDSGWPEALIVAEWPEQAEDRKDRFFDEAAEFERVRELVRGIRAVRSEYGVEPSRLVPATIIARDKTDIVESQKFIIAFLARLDKNNLIVVNQGDAPDESVTVTVGDITAYLPLADLIDLEKERSRLESEIKELDIQIHRVGNLLDGDFSRKAPANVVERERDKLERYKTSHIELSDRLEQLRRPG
jgi:valyl-tRNA synthetase